MTPRIRYVTCTKCGVRYRYGTRHVCKTIVCPQCGVKYIVGPTAPKHVCAVTPPPVTPPPVEPPPVTPPPVTPTPTPTTIHNLKFISNQTYRDVLIGGPGEQVRHINGAHDVLFENAILIGGGSTDVMTLGDGCGSLTNVTFRGGGCQCNLGTENAARSLGLNNIGISDDDASNVKNLVFDHFTFGMSNGVRSGCPRMNVEVLNRGGNLEKLHFLDCLFEQMDETTLDIETDAAHPTLLDILIQGCILKGGVWPLSPEPRWQQTICLELAPGARILNNDIGNSRWGAIEVYDRTSAANSGIQIIGNHIRGNVYLTGAHGVTVTGNTFAAGCKIIEQDGASGNTIGPNTYL